jgi:HK97 family phage portal protein
MSGLFARIKGALLAETPMSLPRIHALSEGAFYSLDDPRIAEFLSGGATTSSGVTVNERLAMKNSAINRAVRLICSSIGMLPCHLFRWEEETYEEPVPEGAPEGATPETKTRRVAVKATDHPVYRILHRRPNSFQTPFDFKTYMMSRAIFDGIAFAYKQYTIDATVKGGRRLKALIPLDPKKVEAKLNANWEMEFWWTRPDGTRQPIPWRDMFWFRSPYSFDGVTGAKLVDVAAEAIGLAHQAEKSSSRVLRNGALVGGVLEHPKSLSEPAANRLKSDFEERHASPENAGKWIVADEGMKVVSNSGGTTLKDAEASAIRKFQAEEVGRFLDIPRPLLMLDETSWGSGIEVLGIFLITYCLLAWFVQFEEAVARSLLTEEEADNYFAKFNEAALLRGSLKDQAEFMAKALGSGGGYGWSTQNEARDRFNQPPLPGGDVLPKPTAKASGDGGGSEEADEPPEGSGGQRQQRS